MLYAAATIGARRAAKRKHAGARALPTRDRTTHFHTPMAKRRRWRRSSSRKPQPQIADHRSVPARAVRRPVAIDHLHPRPVPDAEHGSPLLVETDNLSRTHLHE